MIKKEGKTLAASIKQSAYYGGEPEKTGYIVNAAGVMEVFTDVAKDTWYHDAVVWCTVNDLVKGIGNNIFLCT